MWRLACSVLPSSMAFAEKPGQMQVGLTITGGVKASTGPQLSQPAARSFGSPPRKRPAAIGQGPRRPALGDAPITRALRYCAMTSRPLQPVHTQMRSDPVDLAFASADKGRYSVGRPQLGPVDF
jgi:hypothetical protein